MSVTFSVYPLKEEIPTFREVIELTTKKLGEFLRSYEIEFNSEIDVKLVSKKDGSQQKVDLDSLAVWDNEVNYSLFSVIPFQSGVDVYYWELDEEEKADYMEEVLDSVERPKENPYGEENNRKILVKECFDNKREWHVKKWAGQHYIASVAFGFIASSFAQLTDGIIYSADGGWDYQIFPATAKEFDKVYFRPENAISEDRREEVSSYLEELRLELI